MDYRFQKKYTELLRGNIYFESEGGKGKIFYIEIPVNGKNNSEILTEGKLTGNENNIKTTYYSSV